MLEPWTLSYSQNFLVANIFHAIFPPANTTRETKLHPRRFARKDPGEKWRNCFTESKVNRKSHQRYTYYTHAWANNRKIIPRYTLRLLVSRYFLTIWQITLVVISYVSNSTLKRSGYRCAIFYIFVLSCLFSILLFLIHACVLPLFSQFFFKFIRPLCAGWSATIRHRGIPG